MYESITDIRLSLDGDLVMDGGDLSLTSGFDWYTREVNKRLRSGADWVHHPSLGANIHRFVGQPNTRQTGTALRDAVSRSLSIDAIHAPAQLDVQVVPTSLHDLHLVVAVSASGERTVVSHTILDLVGGTLEPVADPAPRTEAPIATPYIAPNKYLNRLRGRG